MMRIGLDGPAAWAQAGAASVAAPAARARLRRRRVGDHRAHRRTAQIAARRVGRSDQVTVHGKAHQLEVGVLRLTHARPVDGHEHGLGNRDFARRRGVLRVGVVVLAVVVVFPGQLEPKPLVEDVPRAGGHVVGVVVGAIGPVLAAVDEPSVRERPAPRELDATGRTGFLGVVDGRLATHQHAALAARDHHRFTGITHAVLTFRSPTFRRLPDRPSR